MLKYTLSGQLMIERSNFIWAKGPKGGGKTKDLRTVNLNNTREDFDMQCGRTRHCAEIEKRSQIVLINAK